MMTRLRLPFGELEALRECYPSPYHFEEYNPEYVTTLEQA
jgi:hypothetical protein